MITPRAKTGFDKLFPLSVKESLRSEAYPEWNIQPIELKTIAATRFIMLTISSFDFRLIVLLHFSDNKPSMTYVADSLKISVEELSASRYHDYLSETGNILCGAIKRWLLQYFPHLGLSSPNQLVWESLKFVEKFPIDHAIHLKALAEGGPVFFSSLYIYSAGNLDFDPISISEAKEEVEMGALELF